MTLKTFNLEQAVYKQFSNYCKELGISMSKQINLFMKAQTETEPKVREEYLRKLESIRRGRFIKIKNVDNIL